MDARERNSITPINMALIFDALDKMVAEASGTGETKVAVLSRDKLALTLMYELALRSSELLSLNIDSFRTPSKNDFAYLNRMLVDGTPLMIVNIRRSEYSRRGRTLPRMDRILPIFDNSIVTMIEHYLAEVRQHFSKDSDTNKPALFLNTHGARMSYAGLRQRFLDVLNYAGMVEQDYSLHSIRSSAITKKAMYTSLEKLQFWTGHISRMTTVCHFHCYNKE